MTAHRLYGILAEFDSPTDLTHAAEAAREAGYRRMDGYSPFPIEELPKALGRPKTRIAYVVLAGGVAGCLGGYLLQYWSATTAYAMNIGGRPFHSWPAFIPVTFECTILGPRAGRGFRYAGVEWLAQTAPSALRDGAIRPGDARSILPLHRSSRSQV